MSTFVIDVVNTPAGQVARVLGTGTAGVAGVGIPAGGAAGTRLVKIDATNYNTQWEGRIGGSWRRAAAQSINSGSLTSILWDTEDTDTHGFLTPTSATLTIPTGLGGVYAITTKISYAVAALGLNEISILAGGVNYDFIPQALVSGDNSQCGTVVVPLAAAATIVVRSLHSNGAAQNATARLDVHRISV